MHQSQSLKTHLDYILYIYIYRAALINFKDWKKQVMTKAVTNTVTGRILHTKNQYNINSIILYKINITSHPYGNSTTEPIITLLY